MEKLRRWIQRTVSTATNRGSSSNAVAEDQSTAAAKSSQSPSGTPYTATLSHEGPPPVYKVVTVGGGGVGKSSLIVQFMYDEVQSLKQFHLFIISPK